MSDSSSGATLAEEPPVETRTPPSWLKPAFTISNPLMKALLRSPLHGLVSDALLLVTFTGRRSGRTYSTPVGYEEHDGTLYVTSQTDRVWWKNLRGGTEVTVRLRGEEREGRATVVEANEAVADYVLGFIDRRGLESVSRLALAIEGDEVPGREALAAGLADVVVIEIELADGDDRG